MQSLYLNLIEDIFQISRECNTKTFIWGGFVHDILTGNFIREHSDLDGFTLNLWDNIDEIGDLFRKKGYSVTLHSDTKMLRIEKDHVHALFNGLRFKKSFALWFHGGDEAVLCFPKHWLSEAPVKFYTTEAFVSGIEFEYLIKTHPYLLNPNWNPRSHDIEFRNWLSERMDLAEFKRVLEENLVWCESPYWAKKGFPQYRTRLYPTTKLRRTDGANTTPGTSFPGKRYDGLGLLDK